MAHLHSVYDTDKHFIIDAVTRAIQNTSDKIKLMQNDHDSERLTFEIPRYIDGHDMSVCNKVEVHFNNIEAAKTATSKDVYPVKDLQISPDSKDVVIFSWLISQKATKHAGTLNFCVRFACLAEDATIEYQWFSDIHKGITVSEGICNTETILKDYSDILEQWKQELESIKSDYAQNDPTQPDYIKNRIAYYCRKFDDIEAKEYAEPVFAVVNIEESGETYTEPMLVKLAELPDNTTPKDIIDELIGFVISYDGGIEEIRFDDPDFFPEEEQQYISYENLADEEGKYIGSSFCLYGQPYVVAVNSDRVIWNYLYSYEDEGETYEELLSIFFPEKGIYTSLIGYEENEDGTMSYESFYKILFKDVKKIDKNLLPSEIFNQKITVDDEPILSSLNPISSGAVYDLKTSLEYKIRQTAYDIDNKKMDKIPVSISDNGKILGVVNGRLTLVSIASAEDEVF